jgi:uncharacterized membrane protein YoaK (UPF0700 family)
VALAMGVRNAAVRRIGVPDLTTTVLTGTLTSLAANLRIVGGPGDGTLRRTTTVLAMLTGAIAGAFLLKVSLFVPLTLAAGLALATWLLYAPAAVRAEAS